MTKLTEHIQIRLTKTEKNRIKFLADKFAEGNISLWIIYCSLNMSRKKITKKDLEHRKALEN